MFLKIKKNTLPKVLPSPREILGNEKGTALVLALVLGLVGLVMVTSVIYMVNTATWTSGAKRRYQTSLTAAYGGMNFFTQEIIPRGLTGTALNAMGNYGTRFSAVGTNFATKLSTTGSYAKLIAADGSYDQTKADARFTLLLPGPDMNVDTTIVNSNLGNSGTTNNMLLGGGVVNANNGLVIPQHIPYLFQTDVSASYGAGAAANENAGLSSIYAY